MGIVSSLLSSSKDGVLSTITQSFVDPQELAELRNQQGKIEAFVVDHFFYAIPVSTRKKATKDAVSPLWIEPLPEIVEQSLAGEFPEGQVGAIIVSQYCFHVLFHLL
jgi:hypothetical protein